MLITGFVDPVAIRLGPISIRWYGILFVTAILAAVWTTMRAARNRGLDPEFVPDAAMVVVPAGIIGARLYEVFVLQWPYYRQHPGEILAIWHGGLAIHGGVLGALLVGAIFAWYRRQPFWLWADMASPGLILAQAIGRWGNFFNQEAYGDPAPAWLVDRMPGWLREGMTIHGTVMHPTFLYESLWNLAVFGVLYWVQQRRPPSGVVFCLYLILYNVGRFFIESIRQDSTFIFGLRVAQVMAVALILVGAALLLWRLAAGRQRPHSTAP
ncbi:MAG TPA: prolipoprotein diacylglyceryl transferase [Symbiobacteriaceae bacterium]